MLNSVALSNLVLITNYSDIPIRNFFVDEQGTIQIASTRYAKTLKYLKEHFRTSVTNKSNEKVKKAVSDSLRELEKNYNYQELLFYSKKVAAFLEVPKDNPLIKSLEVVLKTSTLFQNIKRWTYSKQEEKKIDFSEMPLHKENPTGIVARIKARILNRESLTYYRTPKAGTGNRGTEALAIFVETQAKRIMRFMSFGFYGKYFSRSETEKDLYAVAKDISENFNVSQEDMKIQYIGHATVLIQIKRKNEVFNLLVDPMFYDLNPFLYPRKTKPACTIGQLPRIDAVYISHDHLDHCDDRTLREIKRYNPVIIVPEGNGSLFRSMGLSNVEELKWGQTISFDFSKNEKPIEMTAVPSDHWSSRKGIDTMTACCNGMVVDNRVYISGDTAKLPEEVVKKIHYCFPYLQVNIEPGGPNRSRSLMKATHQSFIESLRAYLEGVSEIAKNMGKTLDNLHEDYWPTLMLYHHNCFELGIDRFNEAHILSEHLLINAADRLKIKDDGKRIEIARKNISAYKEKMPDFMKREIENEDSIFEKFGPGAIVKALEHVSMPKVGEVLSFSSQKNHSAVAALFA
ncbi:MAG: MBL fold metallo-hydrolase [Parachlamydiales bacterium]|nr:MBL fold metallo-hydrolase [Parachlamydiales bacterium]